MNNLNNISKETIKIVSDFYFDINNGLPSAEFIYQHFNKTIKLNDIKLILQNVKNIKDKNVSKKKLYIPIVQVPNSYQIDLTFYDQYAKNNNGYGILLVIINMNSKYLYVYPLKNKKTETIITAMKQFINKVDDIKIIESDAGSEFISQKFRDLLNENNIQLLTFDKSLSPNAMAIVERANKTIRDKIDKYMTVYQTHKFIDVLDKLVNNYNNSKSYSTGYKPNEVDDKIENEIYGDISLKKIQILNEINNTFNIGDNVKILKNKKLFSKGATQYYSKSIYRIIGKEYNQYQLKNLQNGKLRSALPFQMKKVSEENNIINPFLKDKNIIQKDKQIFDKSQQVNKQNRKLKREGIDDTIKEQNDKDKLNKKLKRQGLTQTNIIK